MKPTNLLYPVIPVIDQDTIEIHGYHLWIHEFAKANNVKGVIQFTPWQWRQLLRAMVEDGIEIKDWSCVDLSWVVED